LFNRHLETILPALLKKNKKNLPVSHHTLNLSDGDFIEYDFYSQTTESNTLVICTHGLEGNSQRPYLSGVIKKSLLQKYDVIAWNFRGCGNKPNYKKQYYHSGFTSDLQELIAFFHLQKKYVSIVLIGISVGGNITLKYLGEQATNISNKIKAAFVLSVPCDLSESSEVLSNGFNKLYLNRFLKSLKNKIELKRKIYTDIDPVQQHSIHSFKDFDDIYTAKFYNYKDANEYYALNSSIHFIEQIKIPTLLLTAMNDPFLTERCIPYQQAENNPCFFLEVSKEGGHVGFTSSWNFQEAYYENCALNFIKRYI
jgi:predicted alpha/beta-fold hydrolase